MLKNVAGNEASLDYENNTATTVNVDGTSRNVKEPYVMASFASFDTEHPKIIKVNNDKGMNQDGSFVAVVLAMPGLTQSPQLDNMVDLPESVTFLPCIRVGKPHLEQAQIGMPYGRPSVHSGCVLELCGDAKSR